MLFGHAKARLAQAPTVFRTHVYVEGVYGRSEDVYVEGVCVRSGDK